MEQKLSEKLLNQQFEQIATSFLGGKNPAYGKDAVERFLQSAAVNAEELEKKNKDLERKIEMMEAQKNYSYQFKGASEEELSQIEKDLAERSKTVARMEKSFTRMVIVAEEQAEDIRNEAHEEAQKIIGNSEKMAADLLVEAKRRKEEANKEAELIISEANNRKVEMEKRYGEIREELTTIHSFIENNIVKSTGKQLSEQVYNKQEVAN